MNARAIMFAVLGLLLVGGLTSWSVMKDMRRIRAENAQKAATNPTTTPGQQSTVPSGGADPNQQQYQQGGTTDQYGSQGYDQSQQQGYGQDPGYSQDQSQQQGYSEDPGYSLGYDQSQQQGYVEDPGYGQGTTGDQYGDQTAQPSLTPS